MRDCNTGPSATITTAPRCASASGRVVWHELRTTDTVRAREFYSALFGWAVQPPWTHPDDRAVLQLHGSDVATVAALGGADGEDSHWLPFVAVSDVEGCSSRVPELRGSVYQSALPRCGAGAMAVLEDPQGAVWAALAASGARARGRPDGLRPAGGHRSTAYRPTVYRPTVYRPTGFQPGGHQPVGYRPAGYRAAGYVDRTPAAAAGPAPTPAAPSSPQPSSGVRPGSIGRALLLTPDLADARQFYGALLGWHLGDAGSSAANHGALGPASAALVGGCEVAMVVSSTPTLRERLPRPSWLPSVHVASLHGSLASAWALGATILLDDAAVPGLGLLGLIQDPTGAALALVEPSAAGCS